LSLPALFTLARIIAAGLLFWAFAKHSYNYYVVLRWVVFLVASLGVYRAYEQKDREWMFVLAHVALAIVFNPFTPLHFERSTWTIINLVSALAILFTLLFIDDEPLSDFFSTSTGKKINLILSAVFGLLLICVGFIIIRYSAESIWDGAKLYRYAEKTQAQVTKVKHRLESSETDEGGGQIYDVFTVSYEFQTGGKTYRGHDDLHLGVMRESYGDRFDDLFKEEITLDAQERIFLQIQYEPSNPDNNQAVESMDGFESSIFGGAIMLFLGVWPIISGFKMFMRNIKGTFTRMKAQS